VIGLGLIGLLTCQFLMANGCRAIGIDIAAETLRLAAGWGIGYCAGQMMDALSSTGT
jgi:UDP-N-acetyl-D-mannosaminuronate dehydrogenase